jgi:GNAT superfamily N-acetyltransferase
MGARKVRKAPVYPGLFVSSGGMDSSSATRPDFFVVVCQINLAGLSQSSHSFRYNIEESATGAETASSRLGRKMNLSYRDNYWDSPEHKEAFVHFLIQIFGLDLSLWDRTGFWDHRYRPFSYFAGDSVVSNVCVYSMDMTVLGKRCRLAQISAVGTIPEYRRRGLSRKLLQAAMNWAHDRHDFFFLFADEIAFQLYRQCGFRPGDEHKARIMVSGIRSRAGVVKLDMQRSDHRERAFRMASAREPVSNILGVDNAKLFMYWCLYSLRDCIYHIPELDVLVLYRRASGLLTVYDIVGSRVPAFADIYPYIGEESDRIVEFLFMVDRLGLEDFERERIDRNGMHLRGNFPLEGTRFMFPFTSHA